MRRSWRAACGTGEGGADAEGEGAPGDRDAAAAAAGDTAAAAVDREAHWRIDDWRRSRRLRVWQERLSQFAPRCRRHLRMRSLRRGVMLPLVGSTLRGPSAQEVWPDGNGESPAL